MSLDLRFKNLKVEPVNRILGLIMTFWTHAIGLKMRFKCLIIGFRTLFL
jgi:hypothetical protein